MADSIVGRAAVSDFRDGDKLLLLVDAVDDAIIANAVAIMASQFSGERLDVAGVTRFYLELIEAPVQPPLKRGACALKEPPRVTA